MRDGPCELCSHAAALSVARVHLRALESKPTVCVGVL